jgi:4a-hydroxytetrahydrobiopterin dehydratase
MKKFNEAEIQAALKDVSGWSSSEKGGAIVKNFEFKNFRAAWTFMEDIAMEADKMNHHPEWKNAYNRVEIKLSTHDAGGITEKDIELAAFINAAEEVVSNEDF